MGAEAFKLYNNECSDDEAYFNKQVVPEDLWGMQEGDFEYQSDFADEDSGSEDQPNDADSESDRDNQPNVSDDQADDDSDDEASTCIHARS